MGRCVYLGGQSPDRHAQAGDGSAGARGKVSFIKDVLPILSKAGCSAGACHAKAEGQRGFSLSVFAYDTRKDWKEITEDAFGRVCSDLPGREFDLSQSHARHAA